MESHILDENVFRQFLFENLQDAIAAEIASHSKRYAIYLPVETSDDDEESLYSETGSSNWEPSSPDSTPSLYSTSSACPSNRSSPAQDVVTNYRAGLLAELSRRRSSIVAQDPHSRASSTYETCISPSSYTSQDELVNEMVNPRDSCQEALTKAREEALDVMQRYAGLDHQQLICQRPGCHNKLRDVKALAYHLHIHNLTDGGDAPHVDDGCHDGGCHLSMSTCYTPPGSSKKLPLKSIRRIISKVVRRK
ncbi:hypothetical protein AMATHDRAFT_65671 [Amanita thiersii Skay4041]|uniref:Uncharacterized protein n=1 Tax=Amanita thiersii Skay4041 TaxID=703135 RepID=A0A2A9NJB8_9AGAR|nr:hypothetical protein AMATHDRAFT_65671 [Amanita thiersii Skay4041]